MSKKNKPVTEEQKAPSEEQELTIEEQHIAALQYVFENVRDRKIYNYVGRYLGHPIEEQAAENSFEKQGIIPPAEEAIGVGGATGNPDAGLQDTGTDTGTPVPS